MRKKPGGVSASAAATALVPAHLPPSLVGHLVHGSSAGGRAESVGLRRLGGYALWHAVVGSAPIRGGGSAG